VTFDRSEAVEFVEWGKRALTPLTKLDSEVKFCSFNALGDLVGEAKVVVLSEAAHGAAEPLIFRNEVFQYLVKEKGFTAIAIESGIVESRGVHEYVRGGTGDLDQVLSQGISWTFDRLPQNRDLVGWIRDYNANARHKRKINFYGFDVPGSPGNPRVPRRMDTALIEALRYLDGVDGDAANEFRLRLRDSFGKVAFDLGYSHQAPGYEELDSSERDTLTAVIVDIISLLERRASMYSDASSVADYEWAHRAAIGARQVDGWLRQIPCGWQPPRDWGDLSVEQARVLANVTAVRDRAQAENLDWIDAREGPTGKILVYGHRYHLSAAPLKWSCTGGIPHQAAGTYLRRRYRKRLLTIGNLIGEGEIACGAAPTSLRSAPVESIDGLGGEMQCPAFYLDLRAATDSVRGWLSRERLLGRGPLDHSPDTLALAAGRAFDVLLYFGVVTPACPWESTP
jgi:erythromycin esterase